MYDIGGLVVKDEGLVKDLVEGRVGGRGVLLGVGVVVGARMCVRMTSGF